MHISKTDFRVRRNCKGTVLKFIEGSFLKGVEGVNKGLPLMVILSSIGIVGLKN